MAASNETEFFELEVESRIDSFSRVSNAESVREDEDELLWAALSSGIDSFSRASNAESVREDEDELLWAALSRFPSQKQTNFALVRLTVSKFDGGKERSEAIDVRKLDCFNRELVRLNVLWPPQSHNPGSVLVSPVPVRVLLAAAVVAAAFFFVLSFFFSFSSSSSFLFLPLSRGLNHRRSRCVWRRNDLADSRGCKMGEGLDGVQNIICTTMSSIRALTLTLALNRSKILFSQ
ncbi:hypothetical protein TEA_011113 [Camellia sinensis var. sinensis]|uniref:Uncharacterized protein n=1 Tax=Camellia sinensis var. sinensis TaxID=542762 RepID=A0A4S4EA37_CAMSN|nr:hypothetical protein TEA_011113 [Camellia sinensis var. sinensis]